MLLLLSTLSLSGCITTSYITDKIEDNTAKRWVADEALNDTIIAIGKPSQPIAGYEDALILAGNKNSYLIQPTDSKNDNLIAIFEKLDLNYLSIKPDSIGRQKVNFIQVQMGEEKHNCVASHGCSDMTLTFKKPTALLTDQEKAVLRELKFSHLYEIEGVTYYRNMLQNLKFTITTPVANQQQLQHRLKQPMPIKFYRYDEHNGIVARRGMQALIPLTLAFDIITFPFQIDMVDINK
ncbi:hypothetical protein A6J60_008140 [Psychrobacter sp. FDAARGOS_221]|nr:hypothetical protein A6J60_008140 [Psychrobacter sp. FDAARGOS_221]